MHGVRGTDALAAGMTPRLIDDAYERRSLFVFVMVRGCVLGVLLSRGAVLYISGVHREARCLGIKIGS